MRYRKLTSSGDYSFGRGTSDWYVNQPEAVAQAVQTRLRLETGEWFLDTTEGTPWRTKVLGKRTSDTRDIVIRARILGTSGVTAITAYNSDLNRTTRGFTVAATISTAYGETTVEAPL